MSPSDAPQMNKLLFTPLYTSDWDIAVNHEQGPLSFQTGAYVNHVSTHINTPPDMIPAAGP